MKFEVGIQGGKQPIIFYLMIQTYNIPYELISEVNGNVIYVGSLSLHCLKYLI